MNQGANAAGGRWTDAVYLSADPLWDSGDTLVGRVVHSGSLAVGQNYPGELQASLPAVNPGQYHVIVRTDVRNQVRESDETNNTTPSTGTMSVDVPELQLGVPFNLTLQTGQERYRKLNAPGSQTLLYTLHTDLTDTQTELFARQGSMASRSAFDFLFSRPGEANQEIVVPNTHSGFYYDLIRGAYVPSGTAPVIIKAEVIPFSIRSVSPSRVGDNGQVTITLVGARFQDGATVQLVGNGTTLTAAKAMVLDAATVKARFFLTNAPHGVYDLVLINPTGMRATLQQSVTIEGATAMSVSVAVNGNTRPRVRRPSSINAELVNSGNVDIQYALVHVGADISCSLELNGPNGRLPRLANIGDNEIAVGTQIDRKTTAAFILRNLEPGQSVPFATRIKDVGTGQFHFEVTTELLSDSEFEIAASIWAEDLRQSLIQQPELPLDQDTLVALADPGLWRQFVCNDLIALGLLDEPLAAEAEVLGSGTRSRANELTTNCRALGQACRFYTVMALVCRVLGFVPGTPPIVRLTCFVIPIARRICDRLYHRDCPPPTPPCSHSLEMTYLDGRTERTCFDPPPGCADWRETQLIGGPAVGACVSPVQPGDPNDKNGPIGIGARGFVGIRSTLPYRIDFENVPTATAAAQRVRIVDQLDPNLDGRTFRLKEIGFGNYRITVPDNRAFYQTRLQLGPDLGNLQADISAGIDIATGQVTWTLTAIDPQTGEQPVSGSLGLLPPNDSTGRGQGYVTYTVQPKATATTGSQISNKATITFDVEEPIITKTVTNTLDADTPSSAVAALPAVSQPTFTLSWSGADPPGGSGLQSFDIWMSQDNGPYQPFVTATTDTGAQFTGQPGSTYRFYSIARDNAGNVEATPSVADAVTTVPYSAPTSIGSPVTVQLGNITVIFTTVTAEGTTTAAPIDPNAQGAPPSGTSIIGPADDIATTATYSGPVRVCFNLPSITDPNVFSHLKLLHGENGALVDRTVGQNFSSQTLCASVDSLSPFIVAQGSTPTAAPATLSGTITTADGLPLAGVTMRLAGSQSGTTINDSNGIYEFDNLQTGNFYTVTPSLVNYHFSPANRSFSLLANMTDAVFTATPDAVAVANAIDTTEFFVRQQYLDFLHREPDAAGFDYWTSQIAQCNSSDKACIRNRRIDVSNAFFFEQEYQQTAAFACRLYRAAYGNNQPFPNPQVSNTNLSDSLRAEGRKIPSYTVFSRDRARLIGSSNLAQDQLALANLFVQRPEFLAKYPASQDGPSFVNAVLATMRNDLGVDLTSQSTALLSLFNSGGRGAVIYRLAVRSRLRRQRRGRVRQ